MNEAPPLTTEQIAARRAEALLGIALTSEQVTKVREDYDAGWPHGIRTSTLTGAIIMLPAFAMKIVGNLLATISSQAKTIEGLREQQGWSPIDEYTGDERTRVLLDDGLIVLIGYFEDGEWWSDYGDPLKYKPWRWQSLPRPGPKPTTTSQEQG